MTKTAKIVVGVAVVATAAYFIHKKMKAKKAAALAAKK